MAIQILAQMQFPQLSLVAYYDDVASSNGDVYACEVRL